MATLGSIWEVLLNWWDPVRPVRHPTDRFCQSTMERLRAGYHPPSSIERQRWNGNAYFYDVMRDTIQWIDEMDFIECGECADFAIRLLIRRRTLWGESPTDQDSPELWASMQKHCPEWPGFQRLEKPEWHDAVVARGREDTAFLLTPELVEELKAAALPYKLE